MISLHELQAAMGRFIASETPDALLTLIEGDASQARARLSIYRHNVISRLTKALREAYPTVCRLVGESFFDYAADAYIRTALPKEGCLADYGGTFPTFLAGFPAAAGLSYLSDVASLEWCIHVARRAARPAPLPIGTLADQDGDPALIRLEVAPWLGYLSTRHNVDQIWAAHQQEGLLSALKVESIHLTLQVTCLDGLVLTRLSMASWVFRSALAHGRTLGEVAAAATRTFARFDLAAELSAFFSEGCVVGIDAAVGAGRPPLSVAGVRP